MNHGIERANIREGCRIRTAWTLKKWEKNSLKNCVNDSIKEPRFSAERNTNMGQFFQKGNVPPYILELNEPEHFLTSAPQFGVSAPPPLVEENFCTLFTQLAIQLVDGDRTKT
ncbi:hypothetical protein AVEN_225233-1 [Araneus ventricosus]|uniref:Uncharacterized protein n=1 Tax=Araneus ventricosus TaxID=182803 RepID=A0A4Y2AMT6_ARAVE|nr:hypothetical protein AVEN_225233-1 [Araneus ventricosus]